MLDNHIQQGNELGIDVRRITWKRVVDMNDRQLRNIVCGLGGPKAGMPREDGFDITVASEVMAIFCLATSITDLKERLGKIVVAYTYDDEPVTAHDLGAEGAMAALLKDALKPISYKPSKARLPSCMAVPSRTSRMAAIPSWQRAWRSPSAIIA